MVDVGDGLVEVVDHFDAYDRGEVFGVPVFFGGVRHHRTGHAGKNGFRSRIAAHFHALGGEDGADARQESRCCALMHQQRFGRVARAVFLGLGVFGDDQRLFQVELGIDIGVAVAVQMLDYRHLGFLADALDQSLAAARDDHVDIGRHGDQFADGGAVGGFHHLHGVGRQAGRLQCLGNQFPQGQIRLDGLGAAAQDAGIAALDRQRGGFDGDVGPALENHAEHAERYAHLADAEAGGQALDAGHFTDRIGHRGELVAAFGHGGDDLVGQAQAVDHRCGEAGGLGGGDVARIGVAQRRAGGEQQPRQFGQGVVLCPGRGAGHRGRGGTRLLADALHVSLDVHFCVPW